MWLLGIFMIHRDKFFYLTFPNDPWPKTRRSSNCDGDAFSNPSLVTSVTSICTSSTLVSVNLKRKKITMLGLV